MATCEISSTGSSLTIIHLGFVFVGVFLNGFYHVKSPFFSTIRGICTVSNQIKVMGANSQPPLGFLGEKLSLSRFFVKERYESSIVPNRKKSDSKTAFRTTIASGSFWFKEDRKPQGAILGLNHDVRAKFTI